ncbi:MAG: thymidylate kinase [Verrucomicrobiaceae bacterium]|nr:thymidylate kinase [Verrucomicrobiaceae bacterium]
MTPGLLISFEGSEGCGKSTQIQRLRDRLQAAGRTVEVLREPGGTIVGEHIRRLLQHTPEVASLAPEAELLLFAASRAQLVREKIRPYLEAGQVVVLDRFLDSTTVYQGIARGLPLESVRAINQFVVGGTLPHLTIVLDMSAAAAWQRIQATGRELDRMERQPLEFFEKVRQGYLHLAVEQPGRMIVLDAAQPPEAIEAQIWKLVEDRCHALQS